MKKYYYDLHIHSCLSPCADDTMTPFNIVNMAILKGLDIIAITDHNSCKNCPPVVKAAKGTDLLVICGMELCTIEEIHVLCLFEDLNSAMEFDSFIEPLILNIKNDVNAFGNQLIYNENDEIVENYDKLLITAANISIQQLPLLIKKFKGIAIPAHIDKHSYSIISVLGTVPQDLHFNTFEITLQQSIKKYSLSNKNLVFSSDAHYLKDINEKMHWLKLNEKSAKEVINILSKDSL